MCKCICLKYRVKREFGKSPFENGAKYCKLCGLADEIGIYIKWEGVHCPCCGFKLRLKSRHKKPKPKRKCIECNCSISMRGNIPIWFKDKKGNDVCWKCWFKVHKAVCLDCGKTGRIRIGVRNFTFNSKGEIRCAICGKIHYYQQIKKKEQKSKEKPILQ